MMFLVGWLARSDISDTVVARGAAVMSAPDCKAAKDATGHWVLGQGYAHVEITGCDRIHNPDESGVLATVAA